MTLQDRADALRSAVEFPESWKPEAGETLIGEVLGWERVATKSSGECEVLTVRTSENVERSVWTWHAQLRYLLIADKSELEKVLAEELPRKCEPGDFVAIHYRGKSAMEDGNEAASYRVAIDRPEETSDAALPF